jgi:1,4-dihydroxy-2-naphthoate polyprenyltransferase
MIMPGSPSAWILAARPKTLSAAVIPVSIGSAIAFNEGVFDLLPASIALLCALLIQIGTNFANDYYDFKKGADNDKRIGFKRAVSSGLIRPEVMLRATWLVMSIAFFSGLILVWHAGWIVLAIGVVSLICGLAYTGGPYPLGYNGLGDIFVFLFFGFAAVMTTYYVQALEWSFVTFWASLAVGALAVNILVVNNLRDSDTDRQTGKRTLGVMFGDNVLKLEYSALYALTLAVPPHFFMVEGYNAWALLPLATAPWMIWLIYRVWTTRDKKELNPVLESTAALMAVFGFLFTIGIVLNAS